MCSVALLAEGVDRNPATFGGLIDESVALLAEGVDRNPNAPYPVVWKEESPSSRRAWIEIIYFQAKNGEEQKSPSSRRAWIEI